MNRKYQHLLLDQCNGLLRLLQKFEDLFNETLGTWEMDPIYFELKKDKKGFSWDRTPYQSYVNKCSKIIGTSGFTGDFKEIKLLQMGSSIFSPTKTKTNNLWLISDFRDLNRQIKCTPYPMPKRSKILLKLEGFKYTM